MFRVSDVLLNTSVRLHNILLLRRIPPVINVYLEEKILLPPPVLHRYLDLLLRLHPYFFKNSPFLLLSSLRPTVFDFLLFVSVSSVLLLLLLLFLSLVPLLLP